MEQQGNISKLEISFADATPSDFSLDLVIFRLT